jgi:hypothetical protein
MPACSVKGGFSMKKVHEPSMQISTCPDPNQLSQVAIERSAQKREAFAARIGVYQPEQLVFVDESAVDCHTTYRGYAWAIQGRKATRKAFFCRGRQ